MLEIEQLSKRFSRVYRSPDDIENLKVRVKLREIGETQHEETKVFGWQEKKFSKFERDFYKDGTNCLSEAEKSYHEEVKNLVGCEDLVFSYVEDDHFQPEEVVKLPNPPAITEEIPKDPEGYDYERSLFHATKHPFIHKQTQQMFILADFGEYFQDTWLKREHVLCSLTYDRKSNSLLVFPDFTAPDNPHRIAINTDNSRRFEFWIENASETDTTAQNKTEILNAVSLYGRRLREERVGSHFDVPGKGKLNVHVFLEILRGRDFENGNVYVEYCVELPKNWRCSNPESLTGVSQSSASNQLAHFGLPVDIHLEYNLQQGRFEAPVIYFEVISKGSWSRFRSEGLCYKSLPIAQPGTHHFLLSCLRVSSNTSSENLRRFFIGDSGICQDHTWINKSKNHEGSFLNKFGVGTIGTGQLEVRVNIVHQSERLGGPKEDRERFLLDKLNDGGLMKSVEEVLAAFKKARKDMADARRRI